MVLSTAAGSPGSQVSTPIAIARCSQLPQLSMDYDFQSYVDHFTQKRPHPSEALQQSAFAIKRQGNARRSFRWWSPVFGPEDRGPHLMHAACKKWYIQQMQSMLVNSDAYRTVLKSWGEVKSEITRVIRRWDVNPGDGMPYLYGIYKTVYTREKERRRPIARVPKVYQ